MLESEVMQRIGVLAAAYPHVAITPTLLKVYARMLNDLSPEVLDAACKQCLAECKFFPTIAELRSMALSLATPEGSRLSAAEAWGEVMKAISKYGYYQQPEFSDNLIGRVVELMGWRSLCMSENNVADRAHFMQMYGQLLQREQADARLMPCAREMKAIHKGSSKPCASLPEVAPRALSEGSVPISEGLEIIRSAVEAITGRMKMPAASVGNLLAFGSEEQEVAHRL